jgi:hypothetical protein
MHGYHTIHALAYEVEKKDEENNSSFGDYEKMFEGENDDVPLLVFHYGYTLAKIKDMFNARKIILKKVN